MWRVRKLKTFRSEPSMWYKNRREVGSFAENQWGRSPEKGAERSLDCRLGRMMPRGHRNKEKDSWVEVRMWQKMTGWPWTGINDTWCQRDRRLQFCKVVISGGREVGAQRRERRQLNWLTLGSTRSNGNSKGGCRMGRRGGLEGREVREKKVNFLSKRNVILHSQWFITVVPFSLVDFKRTRTVWIISNLKFSFSLSPQLTVVAADAYMEKRLCEREKTQALAFLRGWREKGWCLQPERSKLEPQALDVGDREGGVILRGSRVLKNNLSLHCLCHVCLNGIWHWG